MDTVVEVSGGYLLARRAQRPPYVSEDRMPARVLSASDRVAPILPMVPLGWVEAARISGGRFSSYADEVQGKMLWAIAADLERFGSDGTLATLVADALEIAAARGDFHSPSAFVSVAAARRFAARVGELPADAVILGLALPEDEVERVAAAEESASFLSRLTAMGSAPEAGGDVVGFEVLAAEEGELDSWLMSPAAMNLPADIEVRPNADGLLATLTEARSLCDLANDRERESEGVHWAPWCLRTYPLVATADAESDTAASEPDTVEV